MSARRVSLKIYGKVQGVFFRESTRLEATRLGLAGWVRNCGDGSVELVAEGEAPALAALVLWCHSGPPAARVREVEHSDAAATGEYADFTVLR